MTRFQLTGDSNNIHWNKVTKGTLPPEQKHGEAGYVREGTGWFCYTITVHDKTVDKNSLIDYINAKVDLLNAHRDPSQQQLNNLDHVWFFGLLGPGDQEVATKLDDVYKELIQYKKAADPDFALEEEFKEKLEKFNKLNSSDSEHWDLKNELQPLDDGRLQRNQKKLGVEVQKSALKGPVISHTTEQHPRDLIKAIQGALAQKSDDELKAYLPSNNKKITQLLTQAKQEAEKFGRAEGQASLNRRLIVSPNSPLHDSEVMLALFSLEVLANRGDPEAKEAILVYRNQTRGIEITIPGMIQSVFASNLYSLELDTLPPNSSPRFGYLPFEDYLKRKEQPYLPKVSALQKAAESLKKSPPLTSTPVPYNSGKWNEYELLYQELVTSIDRLVVAGRKKEILQNMGGWNPEQLSKESREGFYDLFIDSGIIDRALGAKPNLIKIPGMNIEEVVDAICSSVGLLKPDISHGFDRLHLVIALMDQKEHIETKDGSRYTSRQILEKVMQQFKTGVTQENAVAAEQFYVRILLALDALPK